MRARLAFLCGLALLGAHLAAPAAAAEDANPFDPWREQYLPIADYPAVTAEGLEGTWHHYLNPQYTDLPQATYSFKIEAGTLMIGLGSWQTDNGVGYAGPCTVWDGGLVATVRQLQMELDEPMIGPEVAVVLAAAHPVGDGGTALMTLTFDGPVPGPFAWAFEGIRGQTLIFTRYAG